jgi:hypothetical protein
VLGFSNARERVTGDGGDATVGLNAGDRVRGSHRRHPAGVAGMRSPRDMACLTRLEASACAGEEMTARGRGLGHAERAGLSQRCERGRGRDEEGWAGFGQQVEREAAGHEVRKRIF